MNVRRIIAWAAAIAVVAVGVLWPAIVFGLGDDSAVGDPVRFTDYRADFTVDADGRMSAVETITGLFPAAKHGLVRAFSDANAYAPHTRRLPTDVTAEIDGRPTDVATSWQDPTTYLARIGDPHRVLQEGSHVVTISYRVDAVLDPGSTGADVDFASTTGEPRDTASVLLWQVVPAWNNRIDHATVSVTLPEPVAGGGCTVGIGDRERPCVGFDVEGDTVRIRANDLASRTPITVRAGTDVATPDQTFIPWSPRFDAVFDRHLGGLVWPTVLAVVAAIGVRLWLRSIRDGFTAAPVQNAPPDGLGPAQWDFVRTLTVSPDALTATLLHLADEKLITLTEVNETRWTVEGIADQDAWDRVDSVSRRTGALLGLARAGEVLNANGTATAGRQLARARDDLDGAVRKWAERERLVVAGRRLDVIGLRSAGVVAALVAVALVSPWSGIPTLWGLPFAVALLASVPAWRVNADLRRTEAGLHLTSKARGFHRLLATGSSEARFDFSGRSGIYTSYVPYAVVAGIAARWAATFEKVTGTPAPEPPWSRLDSAGGAAGVTGLQYAVAASIGSYSPVASIESGGGGGDGGSYGGSGGGFGGGGGDGGGGGGGGSW